MDKILSHFSETVDDYDTVADKVVFKNEELHIKLVNAIPFKRDEKLNILDLGCGTGHGMKLVAELFPNSIITGIDFSPKIISKAKEKLLEFSKRVKLIEADFNEISFENYDVIISAIAIHNSTHTQKENLFNKIFNSLNRGGVFINADFFEDEPKEDNEHNQKQYEVFLRDNLSGNELKVWLKHAFEEDMPMSLSK